MKHLSAQQIQKDIVIYWGLVCIGIGFLFIPTYWDLTNTLWTTDAQGHGPLILLVSGFLFWHKRDLLVPKDASSKETTVGFVILLFALTGYIFGRTQQILIGEVGSHILILIGTLILTIGFKGIRQFWFPLFFLIFMLPLPAAIVDALTLPMKIAVSVVSESILYNLGYPIAREGVIIQISQYKLLVADACAGLQTVFTLEAMGLLYLHLVKRDSFRRNLSLALLIIPISFFANTVRVISLILITFYYGDEVGQGFLHNFAGIVLFSVALVMIILVDTIIHWFERRMKRPEETFGEL